MAGPLLAVARDRIRCRRSLGTCGIIRRPAEDLVAISRTPAARTQSPPLRRGVHRGFSHGATLFALGVAVAVGVALLDAWLRGDPVGPTGWARAHLANPALWVVDLLPVFFVVLARRTASTNPPGSTENRDRVVVARMEALTRARDEARAASQAKSHFLASMSHELRTPLNAIIGYSEMMREEVAEGVTPDPEDLGRIVTAARHLLQLINNVLDLSRIEVGRMSVLLEPLDVPMLLREVEATVASLAEANHNSFELRVEPALAHVRADPMRLRQILVNLLGNAFKFTKGGMVELVARTEEIDGLRWAVFEVRDTGIGMSQEQVERLFRDYNQATRNIQRQYGGTGLGLALSQRLAALMAGRIEVRSQEGRGSVFTLHLPVPEVTPAPAKGAAEGGRVLLVDDDPITGHLERRLVQAGWDVVRATTAERARRHLSDVRVVLLDLHTDQGAGWDLLQQLGAHENLPVLAISVDDDDHERALALGASAFLAKPVEPRLVSAALVRVLQS